VVIDENVNVTPRFHTFDSSKVKIGPMPQGAFVGTPVEFESKLSSTFLWLLIFWSKNI
jgi:hypothetical protein